MLTAALIFGTIAGLGAIIPMIIGFMINTEAFIASEWLGYLIMLIALTAVFLGIKRYRDEVTGGIIRFVPAFLTGLAIVAIASTIYVLVWEIYLATSGLDFFGEYSAKLIADLQTSGASAEEIEAKTAEIAELGANYQNWWFRAPLTFLEIFPIGLIVALISAALLRNPRFLPANNA